MMKRSAAALAALILSAAAPLAGCAAAGEPQKPARADRLVELAIETAGGRRAFLVEMARTEAEQERGLMFRTTLAADRGMLFPYDPPRVASFWMKNTYIPLDMIFIRPDGTIARIAENTIPESLDPVSAGEPVIAVLEIAGGNAAAQGIAEGDKVNWSDPQARTGR